MSCIPTHKAETLGCGPDASCVTCVGTAMACPQEVAISRTIVAISCKVRAAPYTAGVRRCWLIYLTDSIHEVVLTPDKSLSKRFSVMLGSVVTHTPLAQRVM